MMLPRFHLANRFIVSIAAGLVSAPMKSMACTSASAGGSYGDRITIAAIDADAPATRVLKGWSLLTGRGQDHYFSGCSLTERVAIFSRGEGILRPVSIVPNEGYWYTGYEMTPSSPLLIFRLVTHVGSVPGGGASVPVTNLSGILNPGEVPSAGNVFTSRGAYLEYAVVGRGAAMTSVPDRLAVTFTTTPQDYPGISIPSGLRLAVNVTQPTCRLSQVSFRLPDIAASELSAPGPAASTERFTIGLHCDGDGRSLRLTMKDALDPGNFGTELSPAADSTAQGVLLQLLRDDRPIAMNTSWSTPSIKGDSLLMFASRYYRKLSPLLSGSVGAQAVLTLDYN